MLNITDIVHCFCRGFEAGGGQCDPEQISNFHVRLISPNKYHCMLTLPQNFLENVVEFIYLHYEYSYVDLNLLCKIWKTCQQTSSNPPTIKQVEVLNKACA